MAEKDTIYSSKYKYVGVFDFPEFYKFCYNWLIEETELIIQEPKYVEKVKGDLKDIEIEWDGYRKLTDYFKFDAKIKIKILALKKIKIKQGNATVDTNEGSVEVSIKGTLTRDYKGRFEVGAFTKFMRGVYERWIITSRIDEFEKKIAEDSEEFLTQGKAWLDLEGRK
jgi:hypothetical protein